MSITNIANKNLIDVLVHVILIE